ncbi:hypothetical protein OsJ_08716 [Oryza sativa Japonica Group]|uniref:protein-serine/threonine phosphatase n=1 Tax=Oryza sativa subsp. japonica TaxID=39947 RepID=A3AC97_ORYSJ|nr:hypothetical protein OsJ_08716 [Oryza sativa Japonica Group]
MDLGGEVEDDASAGAAPNPGGIAGGKEGDLDAEDSGGGSGADDAAAAVSHGATSTDSIVLPPEPTSGHLASLLRARKLILVVDLDHTLVNSTADYDISGTEDYAAAVAKLLDPDGVYFGERIISRDESPQPDRKSLDVVFGSAPASAAERAAVVILDDTAEVWEGNSDNLIEMERYHYFASSCRDFGSPWECTHSLSERGVDESERAAALRVLRRVHAGFFAGGGGSFVADVREVIRADAARGAARVHGGVHPGDRQRRPPLRVEENRAARRHLRRRRRPGGHPRRRHEPDDVQGGVGAGVRQVARQPRVDQRRAFPVEQAQGGTLPRPLVNRIEVEIVSYLATSIFQCCTYWYANFIASSSIV